MDKGGNIISSIVRMARWIKSHIWRIASHGDLHTLYVTAENISKLKNSEIHLTQVNQQSELMFQNTPAGICLFDYSVLMVGFDSPSFLKYHRQKKKIIIKCGYR